MGPSLPGARAPWCLRFAEGSLVARGPFISRGPTSSQRYSRLREWMDQPTDDVVREAGYISWFSSLSGSEVGLKKRPENSIVEGNAAAVCVVETRMHLSLTAVRGTKFESCLTCFRCGTHVFNSICTRTACMYLIPCLAKQFAEYVCLIYVSFQSLHV
jgi:hypothetical protein